MRSFRAQLKAIHRWGQQKPADLASIHQPVLVVNGESDKMVPTKNTVDLDAFVDEYGADVARWFVLSDSPPERDVIYTDVGVDGARRLDPVATLIAPTTGQQFRKK